MGNLSSRVEPLTLRSIWERLGTLEDRLKQAVSAINTVKQASATTLARSVQVDDNVETFPNFTWTQYDVTEVPVPAGYTKASVLLFASVGGTFTGGGGNVGVEPYIGTPYFLGGPPVSNGTPGAGPVSCSSFMAADLEDLGDTLVIAAYCQSTNGTGTVVAGSNNVHLSAQIVFAR